MKPIVKKLALAIGFVLMSACGNPLAPALTAHDILLKPGQSAMKDAHMVMSGSSSGATFKGDGKVVFKPSAAMDLNLTTSLGAIPLTFETITINGKTYTHFGSAKWKQSESSNTPNPADVASSDASDLKIAGEDKLNGDQAWHLTGKRSGKPFGMWVRESDGFLLKLLSSSDSGGFSFIFDRFNTGVKISPPPPSDIQPLPKNVSGQIGQVLTLNGVNVTVVSAQTNAKADNSFHTPAAGKMFVVVLLLYENTGTDKVGTGSWSMADSQSFSYQTTFGVRGPALPFDDIPPAGKVRGYIAFEIPTSATGLQLKLKLGDDSATVPIP